MSRIIKEGDVRMFKSYRKFICEKCKCEFIADDSEYKVHHYEDINGDLNPFDIKTYTSYVVTCPCCDTVIHDHSPETISYKEIVKFDEEKEKREKRDFVWG